MASLGIVHEDGPIIGCAQNIYVTSTPDFRRGAKLTFEALETDAPMSHLLNRREVFALEGYAPFAAELTRLNRCDTTVDLLRVTGRPVICGELTIHGPIDIEAKD